MTLSIRTALFTMYSVSLLVGGAEVVRALTRFSQGDASASHLVVIPFITLGLLLQERAKIFSSVRFGWGAGGAIIAVGLAGLVTAMIAAPRLGEHAWLVLSVASLMTLWVGGFRLFYGQTAFAAARFPLLFLYFATPIPAPLLEGAVQILKTGSTEAVAMLFTVIGMPYHREAYVFNLPNLTIEVADACSGIRSSIALFLTGLIAGRKFLDRRWTRGLLLLAIVPVTLLKNAIRIVALSWLAINVDPAFLSGRLHTDGGAGFFVLALILMAPLLVVLRKAERRMSADRHASQALEATASVTYRATL